MKKRLVILLTSFFSLISLASCNETQSSSVCDEMFEDCNGEGSSNQVNEVKLDAYTGDNYTFDDTITNENGSASYEIFVRSFYDSDKNGIGDFKGVTKNLSYLKELGIKTIWLMPIMPSPSYHGYDVTNYYEVNSDYGTLADFQELTEEAKKLNIDIMIDIVFNHSSSQHPWFKKSYDDYKSNNQNQDSKKDWYVWSTSSKTGYSLYNDLYYEARFDSSMPDFNTENDAVRNEMLNILKFWVDKGVDGFRFDAVKYFDYENTTYNASFLSYLKDEISKYNSSIYFVGECWDNINVINSYYKSTFDSFFKFNASLDGRGDDAILGQVKGINDSNKFGEMIEEQEKTLKQNNPKGYSSYFLSNHDMDRSSNSFSEMYAKMAASLTYLMPGTPFMYYGEEILLKGKRNTSPDDQSDVRRRLPMIWSEKNKEGECEFPEKNRTDLKDNDQVKIGAYDAKEIGYSLWNHYKKVLNIRNKYPFMKQSIFTNLTSKINQQYKHVLAYKLSLGDDYVVVIHNFELSNVEIDVKDLGSQIVDEVSCTKLTPKLENNKLKIGRLSTVLLK